MMQLPEAERYLMLCKRCSDHPVRAGQRRCEIRTSEDQPELGLTVFSPISLVAL